MSASSFLSLRYLCLAGTWMELGEGSLDSLGLA